MSEETLGSSSSGTTIDSSNIGFKILKKHGWKEGTGLGVSEQGRLEPVEAYLKNNKRGLGVEKKKKILKTLDAKESKEKRDKECPLSKKTKALSKKMRKMQELEKRLKEKEFERAFFREFWPDNV
ncbi:hypothetical protein SLE2022_142440 [Rubroshorea leprosula]